MLIAQLINGIVSQVADYRSIFPQTSFPPSGPSDEFLAENSCKRVSLFKAHSATQKLSACTPYVEGEWVYTVEIADKTAEEIVAEHRAAVYKLVKQVTDATQSRLDTFAATRNYDGILSACTYASSQIPKFAAEGQYCVNARDNTWATLYSIMAEVEAGTRPMPQSFADIEPDLPMLTWP